MRLHALSGQRREALAQYERLRNILLRDLGTDLEIGAGFFEGVCVPGNATSHFRDPLPPRTYSRMAPG
jgi:hypothetical protein